MYIFNIYEKSIFYFFFCLILIIFLYQLYFGNHKQNQYYNILKKINKWINLCRKEILIRGILNFNDNPKITALITLYNSQESIRTAVKSIQNQLFQDIEILVIDDYSTDNSSMIIQVLQKEDKRIKVIKNKKNKGALYSKSIGILKASGKYIMILDSDDFFANENIFQICYDEAIKNNIDIIEFSGFNLNSSYFELDNIPEIPYYLRFKQENKIILQPDLSFYIYKKIGKYKYKLIDGVLWGKCIKTSIFKMSLKIVGSNIYNKKINYGDDRIINFILFKVANSFKYIQEYGIIYNYNNNSITHLNSFINNCKDELINILSIYNYTKNSKEVEIVPFEIIFRWNNIIFPGLNKINFYSTNKLIKILLSNKYICYLYKLKLISFLDNITESKKINAFDLL